jgi:hypothetical protein
MRLILAISALLVALPVNAATYTYNISFGDPHALITIGPTAGTIQAMIVTGTVVTDCDNCTVYSPISWSFTGSDNVHPPQTVSSTDPNAHLTYTLPAGVVMPLTATPTGLYWDFNYHYADGTPYQDRYDGSDPNMCFCVWSLPYPDGPSYKFLMFLADSRLFNAYFFDYANDPQNPDMVFEHWGAGNMLLGQFAPDPPPSPVPLPGAFWLFASGLIGLLMARRRSR